MDDDVVAASCGGEVDSAILGALVGIPAIVITKLHNRDATFPCMRITLNRAAARPRRSIVRLTDD